MPVSRRNPAPNTSKMAPRRKFTIGSILREFSEHTSAHGVPRLSAARGVCTRAFWAGVILVSICALAWQMILLVDKYLQRQVIVQTELKTGERSFPAVTICNLNPYKRSAIAGTPIAELMTEYERAIENTKSNPSRKTPKYGLTGDASDVLTRATEVLLYEVVQLPNSTRRRLLYEKRELIEECAYDTKACDIDEDFVQHTDPVYGACYIFNFRWPSTYNSSRAGPLYGLRLLVKSNQSEYLDLTQSAGVRVSIDFQTQPPFPAAFGYNAASGFTSSFGVSLAKTDRKGPPYGNCTDTPKGDYFYEGSYSTEGCFRSCIQRHVMDACGCADPRGNLPPDDAAAVYCNVSQMECVNRITHGSQAALGEEINEKRECFCPERCADSGHSVSVTTGLWPSRAYTPPDCKDGDNRWAGNESECKKWYGENTMSIEVYYERMNYQKLTEAEAYSVVNLISDIGGQLGLWLGSSVITVIEFCSLPLLLFGFICEKAPENADVGPTTTGEKQLRPIGVSPGNAVVHWLTPYHEPLRAIPLWRNDAIKAVDLALALPRSLRRASLSTRVY